MHCLSMSAAAEDAVMALMEYLVAPMLPFKSAGRDPPSLSLQESVAKQVHAVVLLYNYYYRKQHPEVEFIGFKSFCQLAVVVKPTLMGHMRLMQHTDFAELDDVENQLSVTEKSIMDACDISSALHSSKNTPSTENWEVSKVAVLLTDSSKENCVLQFSSVTQGVWSVIEKDVSCGGNDGEEGKHINKRKRSAKKSNGDGVNIDKAGLQQLALSAVTEATGINQCDLVVLKNHTVYSVSREKSAVQFYIVQSTLSIDEELKHSIKNIIERLQGPLVKKRNCSWAVTSVVEYFHLLPYAGVIEEWFSREVISNSPQDLRLVMEKVDVKNLQKVGDSFDSEVDFLDMQSYGNNVTQSLKHNNDSGTTRLGLQDASKENPQVKNILSVDNKKIDYHLDEQVLKQENDSGSVTVSKSDAPSGSQNMHIADSCVKAGKIKKVEFKSCTMIDNLSDHVVVQKNENTSVTVHRSHYPGGSQNMDIADSSMVYCPRAAESGNHDFRSCQIIDNLFDEEVGKDTPKFSEKTNASKMSADSPKQTTNNGVGQSSLRDSHTDQYYMATDESCMIDERCKYGLKYNKKRSTNLDDKQSGINGEFSRQITDNGTDLNQRGTHIDLSRQVTYNEIDLNQSEKIVEFSREMIDIGTDVSQSGTNVEFLRHVSDNGSELKQSGINAESSKQITHNGIGDSLMIQHQNGNKLSNGCTITKVYQHKKRMSSSNSNTNGKACGVKVEVEIGDSTSNLFVSKLKDGKNDKGNGNWNITSSDQVGSVIGDGAIVPHQLNADYRDKLKVKRILEENSLSQTALTYLLRKKSKLAHQLRLVEDEIAVCDQNIQTILDGGESELTMQVEAIVDACYDVFVKDVAESQELASQQFGTTFSRQLRRKRLSDALIPSRNSCQELDDICHSKGWILPTYQLYPVQGGFWASIKLKATDFENSEDGDLCVKPSLARESAARKMIAKLQSVTEIS